MFLITSMTIIPIATQKPMYQFVGLTGCQFYWGVNLTWQWLMTISGVGMATYRLICFHDLFKRELLNTKIIAQMILLLDHLVIVWINVLIHRLGKSNVFPILYEFRNNWSKHHSWIHSSGKPAWWICTQGLENHLPYVWPSIVHSRICHLCLDPVQPLEAQQGKSQKRNYHWDNEEWQKPEKCHYTLWSNNVVSLWDSK